MTIKYVNGIPKLVPQSSVAKRTQGISVAADLSPNQQAHLAAIRKELQYHNAANPDDLMTIKYVSGIPKLVPQSSEAKN